MCHIPKIPEEAAIEVAKIHLSKLGNTPTTIAQKLKKMKITGMRTRPDNCPLYNYLMARMKTNVPFVSGNLYFLNCYGHLKTSKAMSWPLRIFILMFDHGFFPYLVKK